MAKHWNESAHAWMSTNVGSLLQITKKKKCNEQCESFLLFLVLQQAVQLGT